MKWITSFWGICILLVIGGITLLMIWHRESTTTETPIVYTTAVVKRANILKIVLSTGTVQPENKLSIKPPIDGRAEEVLVSIGDKVKQGQVLAWMSSTERAALLDVARTKGAKELQRWEDFYRPAALVAPLDGTIIDKAVVPGQVVTDADSVFTFSDHLVVAANLDETDLAKTSLGQEVDLLLDAYPDQPFVGKVERIAYTSTTVSNVTTFEVDILPNQVPDFMRNGMTADLTFVMDERKNVLSIPLLAVKNHDGISTVLMAGTPPETSVPLNPITRTVTLGLSDGKLVEVKSGLKKGESILVEVPNLTVPVSTSLFGPPKGQGPPPGPGGPHP